jgi:uncharacterized protein (DUF58 family)
VLTRPRLLLVIRIAVAILILVAALAVVPRQRLIVTARADRADYAAGEPVTVSVVLAVGASEPVSIQSDCMRYQLGFIVADERGQVVYTSFPSGGLYMCLLLNPVATLQPGWTESRSFTGPQIDSSGSPVAVGHTYIVLPALYGTPSVAPVTAGSQIFVS